MGATHEVTGSCTLIGCGNNRGLIDCGMEQGKDIFENQKLPVAAGDIDFVFLTHAHIDHSGNLQLLFKNGFDGPIYATRETCDLCRIMLRDSAHIQESEAEWRNRKSRRSGGPEYEPVYTLDDAEAAIAHLRPVSYHELVQVGEHFTVRFNDVCHLLGSACIEVFLTENGVERKMVFSGDLGNLNQPIIRNVPETVADADYVMIESTYGDRLHDRHVPPVKLLADYIQRTLDRGGNLVIPSFAVGRTQEMLYYIREIREKTLVTGHDGFPVYVDSPMANEATAIYLQCGHECFDEETRALVDAGINPIWSDGIRISVSSEDSKAINENPEPKVILSASGMCEAGRIRHLGFSSHGGVGVLREFLDAYGDEMEFCQIQLNYLDWKLQDAKGKYELLTERGIPVWVMEPVRGGRLAKLSEEETALLKGLRPDESIPAWSFRWLQGLPNVTMVLSGMSNMEQMEDNVKTYAGEKPLTEAEKKTLADLAEGMMDAIPCTACRYCCDGCPQGLDIPMLLHTYNDLKFSPTFTVGMRIEALPEDKWPSACIGCGACAAICPQSIHIPELLREFTAALEKVPKWADLCRQREEEAARLRAQSK